jgi:hypothetical protein
LPQGFVIQASSTGAGDELNAASVIEPHLVWRVEQSILK